MQDSNGLIGQPLVLAHRQIAAFHDRGGGEDFLQSRDDEFLEAFHSHRMELRHQHSGVMIHDEAGATVRLRENGAVSVGVCRNPGLTILFQPREKSYEKFPVHDFIFAR